jgi:hypothetical protein
MRAKSSLLILEILLTLRDRQDKDKEGTSPDIQTTRQTTSTGRYVEK